MYGSVKSGKLGKREGAPSGSCFWNGTAKNTVKDNTGKAGSASSGGSTYSISPGSGMKTKKSSSK